MLVLLVAHGLRIVAARALALCTVRSCITAITHARLDSIGVPIIVSGRVGPVKLAHKSALAVAAAVVGASGSLAGVASIALETLAQTVVAVARAAPATLDLLSCDRRVNAPRISIGTLAHRTVEPGKSCKTDALGFGMAVTVAAALVGATAAHLDLLAG